MGTLCRTGEAKRPARDLASVRLPAVIAANLALLGAAKVGDLPAIAVADYLALPGASMAQVNILRRILGCVAGAATPAGDGERDGVPEAHPAGGDGDPVGSGPSADAAGGRPAVTAPGAPVRDEPGPVPGHDITPGPTFVSWVLHDLAGLSEGLADVFRSRFGIGRPVDPEGTVAARRRTSQGAVHAMQGEAFRLLDARPGAVQALRSRLATLAFEAPTPLGALLADPWFAGLAPEGLMRLVWMMRSGDFTVVQVHDNESGYRHALVPMPRQAWEANFSLARRALADSNPWFPAMGWARRAWDAMEGLDARRRQAVLDGFGPVKLGDSVGRLQTRHLDPREKQRALDRYHRDGRGDPKTRMPPAYEAFEDAVVRGIDPTPWMATILAMASSAEAARAASAPAVADGALDVRP